MMDSSSPFAAHIRNYDRWYEHYPHVFDAEVRAVRSLLPAGIGMELGVGTGRFASALTVGIGLDPAAPMMREAQRRGVEVVAGVAESIPIRGHRLDYVLMVTVLCFVREPQAALLEAKRVLKPGGRIVVAFIDRNSRLGHEYQARKDKSVYYRDARFYSVDDVVRLLGRAGFAGFHFRQTLTDPLNEIGPNEPVTAGWGQGGFVVVSAQC